MGRILKQEGIEFVYLCGQMNKAQRTRAINSFQTLDEVKVMVSPILTSSTSAKALLHTLFKITYIEP
jgi:hypothetical protein